MYMREDISAFVHMGFLSKKISPDIVNKLLSLLLHSVWVNEERKFKREMKWESWKRSVYKVLINLFGQTKKKLPTPIIIP